MRGGGGRRCCISVWPWQSCECPLSSLRAHGHAKSWPELWCDLDWLEEEEGGKGGSAGEAQRRPHDPVEHLIPYNTWTEYPNSANGCRSRISLGKFGSLR